MPEQKTSLPEPWQSMVTGQIFRPVDKWQKPEVELIDWETTCRWCGRDHFFTLRADYSARIATLVSVRWFGLCRSCRKERAA